MVASTALRFEDRVLFKTPEAMGLRYQASLYHYMEPGQGRLQYLLFDPSGKVDLWSYPSWSGLHGHWYHSFVGISGAGMCCCCLAEFSIWYRIVSSVVLLLCSRMTTSRFSSIAMVKMHRCCITWCSRVKAGFILE